MTAKIVFAAGAVVLAGILIAAFFTLARNSGIEAERQTTIEQNREAGNAGENARLGRRDCVARGMRWDFEAGKCLGRP